MMPVIKRIRLDARVTQRKIAEILGIQELTVKRWEKGLSEPPFSQVCRLVKKYELNILRYMFSPEDLEEICHRGYGDYALKLEHRHYIPHNILSALHDRDWGTVYKIRAELLAETISKEILGKVADPQNWGDTHEQQARALYDHYEDERWSGLAEKQVIDRLCSILEERAYHNHHSSAPAESPDRNQTSFEDQPDELSEADEDYYSCVENEMRELRLEQENWPYYD